MAVYRKKLVDKDGNTIIPAVGDIYGTVYTATLSSATAGGRADYEFTPDTPVENNKVNVYSSNQSIIKDEEIERTGRNYLKHFYEKNEHIVDVDEFV